MTLGSPWHIEEKAPLLARRPALGLSMTSDLIAGMHTLISARLKERVPSRYRSHVNQQLVDLLPLASNITYKSTSPRPRSNGPPDFVYPELYYAVIMTTTISVEPTMLTRSQKRRMAPCKFEGKKFVCETVGCGRGFTRAEHLQRHLLNHSTGAYTCNRCRAHFKRRDLLGKKLISSLICTTSLVSNDVAYTPFKATN